MFVCLVSLLGRGCGARGRFASKLTPRPAGVCLCSAIPAFHFPTCAVSYPTPRSFSAMPVKLLATP